MQAIWNNKVIAEADKEDLIYIEGNWYFPPDALKKEYFKLSDKHTTCFWKGEASYYHINVGGRQNPDAAWFYPEPKLAAREIQGRVAFWRGVQVLA